ncbi:MAG: hypothetical protein IT271_05105 [Chitinophagales bacterium]|nr:hypothetical protein [Chitinophagales bacterium]
MVIDTNLLIKIFPLLSIPIAGLAVYFTYKNRASKHRELIYDKQFELCLRINQKIIEAEVDITVIVQNQILNKDPEVKEAQNRYAKSLLEIANLLNMEGRIFLQNEILTQTSNILNDYYNLLPEILSNENNLLNKENVYNRQLNIVKWLNVIRENFGIDTLSKQNSNIIK